MKIDHTSSPAHSNTDAILGGATLPRRRHHAGHELVYVLEGSATVQVEGKPPVTVPAGAAAYLPPRQVHAGRNASHAAPLRFLLVRIQDKGQPLSVELE